jgi:hypothetical protein
MELFTQCSKYFSSCRCAPCFWESITQPLPEGNTFVPDCTILANVTLAPLTGGFKMVYNTRRTIVLTAPRGSAITFTEAILR